MSDIPESFFHYLAAWNEADTARVRAHLERSVAPRRAPQVEILEPIRGGRAGHLFFVIEEAVLGSLEIIELIQVILQGVRLEDVAGDFCSPGIENQSREAHLRTPASIMHCSYTVRWVRTSVTPTSCRRSV